eukprot:TRINITY_DN24099_c2_g1_i1.p1 TRINITY_DN24099_c2_g1~~TRINITY_DN24099_c2_g1_i1.p1  ORF type:complete len:103 (+),score=10.73 TRINITY_DN24099_c2_g1_i1:130-438(+)
MIKKKLVGIGRGGERRHFFFLVVVFFMLLLGNTVAVAERVSNVEGVILYMLNDFQKKQPGLWWWLGRLVTRKQRWGSTAFAETRRRNKKQNKTKEKKREREI